MRAGRIAVVLFNLGGPDRPESVQPFLFNLFNDPAILRIPSPFRWVLAQILSRRRAEVAGAIYQKLGGSSPLLPNTRAQAAALRTALAPLGAIELFIAMRYWHPLSDETAAAVKAYDPDQIILLPLYPQWSTTTTASSIRAWHQAARSCGLAAPTRVICCYPTDPGFLAAATELIFRAITAAAPWGKPRILFSAHGLPKRVVDSGDPYQWQCEQTAAALVKAVGVSGLDWVTCYQSRVGPLEWIGPSTDDEIRRAGRDRVPVVIVPIAFVSEHSETLVELDLEYRHLAEVSGVPRFERVPTVGCHPLFIRGLADLVRAAILDAPNQSPIVGPRRCPATYSGCACSTLIPDHPRAQ